MTTNPGDLMTSLKAMSNYKDMKVEEDGTIHTNTKQLEDILGQTLSVPQVKNGLRRLYEMYPLYKMPIIDIFPSLQYLNQTVEAKLDDIDELGQMNNSLKKLGND